MAIVFDGRAIPNDASGNYDEFPSASCVFCGKMVQHVDAGGVACIAGAFVDGAVRHFYYCNEREGCCGDRKTGVGRTRTDEDWDRLWECGDCCVDNLTTDCHDCGKPRFLADRSILEPFVVGVDTKKRRWAVVHTSADSRPALPRYLSASAVFRYRGSSGGCTLTIVKFSCDGSAETYGKWAPDSYDVRLFKKKSDAEDYAEGEVDRRFLHY